MAPFPGHICGACDSIRRESSARLICGAFAPGSRLHRERASLLGEGRADGYTCHTLGAWTRVPTSARAPAWKRYPQESPPPLNEEPNKAPPLLPPPSYVPGKTTLGERKDRPPLIYALAPASFWRAQSAINRRVQSSFCCRIDTAQQPTSSRPPQLERSCVMNYRSALQTGFPSQARVMLGRLSLPPPPPRKSREWGGKLRER